MVRTAKDEIKTFFIGVLVGCLIFGALEGLI